MIELKSIDEIKKIGESCRIVAEVLNRLKEMVEPGITTAELDAEARRICAKNRARPAFLGYRGFPAAICASVNSEVVHGIPSKKRILKEGEIVSIDFGVEFSGFFGDAAITAAVGRVSETAEKLMNVTKQALSDGIECAKSGKRLYDISAAVQSRAEGSGFSVVRDFVGHGIGRNLHEDPLVPNFGKPGTGIELKPGMVLAIEPMVNENGFDVIVRDDEWTVVTADGGLSAHFEHTVAITENGPVILSL